MEIKKIHFPDIMEGEKGGKISQKALSDIPVQVTVELGRTKMSLKDILEMAEGSIIELDRVAGEPLDLKIGDQLIGQGEVVAIDDYYGLRITHIALKA